VAPWFLVRLAEERVDEAMAIMERHQAVDIEQRAEKWRAAGWTDEAQNPMTEPLPARQSTRSASGEGRGEGI